MEIIFEGFWNFVGFSLLFTFFLTFLYEMYDRTLDCITVLKKGYPPEHCDSAGNTRRREDNYNENEYPDLR